MNRMKRHLHRVLALLLGCVFLCCPVFAAELCSLHVHILDAQREAVARFDVEVCQITSYDGTSHSLLPEYGELPLSAAELDSSLSAEQAELVFQYIRAHGVDDKVETTNQAGIASFKGLEQGIYLVFDGGDQIYTFPPYLVELPTQAPSGLLYNVNSEPKTVSSDSHTLWVLVEWIDDNDAAGKRPDSVEVTLLRDVGVATTAADTAYRSVVVNSACHWEHTFHSLPHTGVYSVEGSIVPEYKLIEIEKVTEGFVLRYKYTPPQTPNPPTPPSPGPWPDPPTPDIPADEPTLPQTGFKMLPVYALLGVGAMMVVLGMVDLCIKEERE